MNNRGLPISQVHGNSTSLLGVHIHDFSPEEILNFIVQTIQSGKRAIIANVNVNMMNFAYRDYRLGTDGRILTRKI